MLKAIGRFLLQLLLAIVMGAVAGAVGTLTFFWLLG